MNNPQWRHWLRSCERSSFYNGYDDTDNPRLCDRESGLERTIKCTILNGSTGSGHVKVHCSTMAMMTLIIRGSAIANRYIGVVISDARPIHCHWRNRDWYPTLQSEAGLALTSVWNALKHGRKRSFPFTRPSVGLTSCYTRA